MIPAHLPQGYYTKTGTVLLRKDSAKEGQSLLIFMRELGPRWAGAPRANAKNRFGGATEPLTWARYSLYKSPTKLYLQDAEVREDFLTLRESGGTLLCAMRLYKLTAREAPTGCENDALLRALWSALVQLREKCPPAAVEFRYTWKFLNLMGLAPSYDICASCGTRLSGRGVMTKEGVFCASCAKNGGLSMDAAELAELRAAAMLPHEKFLLWSKEPRKNENFLKNIKLLSPYFANMR
ncbi:DNA repair protein RecO [Synergistes jonesii]|uniref:DNA repair protein RecO n=1 Tax=Synergistes jonesii TaxID=2754 RepID=UPI00242C6F65|nr:DNA repair protein RecO [Synergistes jonesii]